MPCSARRGAAFACSDTNRSPPDGLRDRGALLERERAIAVARHHHREAARAQLRLEREREPKRHVLLAQPAHADRAGIAAAVTGVEHDRLRNAQVGGQARRLGCARRPGDAGAARARAPLVREP